MTREEKAAETMPKIKQYKLKLSAETEVAMHRVSDLKSDSEIDVGQKSSSDSGDRKKRNLTTLLENLQNLIVGQYILHHLLSLKALTNHNREKGMLIASVHWQ